MLKIGDKIPNINVTTHKGESVNLSDFKGKKIVLFFYPRANTPGCTSQSCNLNDNYSKLTAQGYEVICVSPDTVDKQNKFADKFGFKYNLLADDSRELIDAFGVWGKNVQKTELDAKRLFPKSKWNGLHLRIIYYGREFCPARGWNIDNYIITKTIGRKSIINKLIK